ncbi:MAG: glutamate--tRNA ligase [Rhodospirillaceae bacterium]
MSVVTRFAPSPTGFLHIGGARTALFNRLFAKHMGGTFLLRIEDTDRERSTEAAVEAIFDGLKWLGLDWDGEVVFQSTRADRHHEAVDQLLQAGLAYRCYASKEELDEMRAAQRAAGKPTRYDGRWRDRDPSEAPAGVDPVIRLKAPQEGETVIDDLVQGKVTVANAQLDDMILLRADGSPTYMLSVVVDDHDMGVTHVIRGDDHLTNAFRQTQLYRALEWDVPAFGHIPLIHGPDGAKLSKRHGALGAEAYRDLGFLPEAMRNYLARLGWSHGDDEIFSDEQAIAWFDVAGVGKSPARFDLKKLTALNAHYMRQADDGRLVSLAMDRLAQEADLSLDETGRKRLSDGMPGMKERVKTIPELVDLSKFYVKTRPITMADVAVKALDDDGRRVLGVFRDRSQALDLWSRESLEALARDLSEELDLKLGKVAQPIRAALTGSKVSPPIFEVMEILGREETLGRIADVL